MFEGSAAHDFVDSKKDSIEEMPTIEDEPLDFIAAVLVIEHTKNPLRVLELAYGKLKKGGRLVLVAKYLQERLGWGDLWWHERVNAHHALEFHFSFAK